MDKRRFVLVMIILSFLLTCVALFTDKTIKLYEYKPYYLTRDKDGTIWIGDKPGQKQEVYGKCRCKE